MDTPAVHQSGQRVASQTPVATGLARRYGTTLTDAGTTVGHATVTNAVHRYRDRWHPLAERVAGQVDRLGSHTGAAAVTVDHTDTDAEATLLATGSPATLTRAVNGPVAV
jgi:hypothetical protein